MPSPPPAEPPVVERARAKLNLDLILTGRRGDGYHELDSIVAFADLADEVTAASAGSLEVACDGPFAALVPGGADNLVHRAATRLAAALGRAPAARLRLEKRLPIAAGIGGGSADAAATLRALARLWRLPRGTGVVAEVAAALGSDVPVCLASRSARMRGVGEQLEPLAGPEPRDLVLVNPGAPLPPSRVFAAPGPMRFAPRAEPPPAVPDLAWLSRSRNDLEPPARELVPVIGEVLAELAARPGCRLARMSGSGPTCFGAFDHPAAARGAAVAIAAARPGWWVAAGRAGDAA